jgi:hypothetical protein
MKPRIKWHQVFLSHKAETDIWDIFFSSLVFKPRYAKTKAAQGQSHASIIRDDVPSECEPVHTHSYRLGDYWVVKRPMICRCLALFPRKRIPERICLLDSPEGGRAGKAC